MKLLKANQDELIKVVFESVIAKLNILSVQTIIIAYLLLALQSLTVKIGSVTFHGAVLENYHELEIKQP